MINPLSAFADVRPTAAEIGAERPGDDIVDRADVVMDRAFTVAAAPGVVWPWIAQLGKGRAGWYLPRAVERFIPRSRRAARHAESRWTELTEGDVIPDYGGRDATFTVVSLDAPYTLVYWSRRGGTRLTWAIVLLPVETDGQVVVTRVCLRLRLAPVKHVRLAGVLGGFFDLVTVAGMAKGLRERVGSAGSE